MTDEIELFSDGEGIVVRGDRSAVKRFLSREGLLSMAQEFDLSKLRSALNLGSDLMDTASGIVEQSVMYLKLTPEYRQRLQDAGGLMPTKTPGISYAMLGETGKHSLKWLQVEDGPASLLLNPAVLSGLGGLMTQFARQAEAQELKALLVQIDRKLDDVRRAQRDRVLAKMGSAAAAIDEALLIHKSGGDPTTLWDKVSGESVAIMNVQEEALFALRAITEKVKAMSKPGELKKAIKGIENDFAVWIAVLTRCFELLDKFQIVELDHVLATAPENLDGHRLGIWTALERRRTVVLDVTAGLIDQMDAAGAIVNGNVLVHAGAARLVINGLNSAAEILEEFHAPLGIESSRSALVPTPWREAIRDPKQQQTAAKELGVKVGLPAGTTGFAVAVWRILKSAPKG